MVCLEGAPNIATLCCGGAVHLNCLAEWLSSHETCVQCRAPLPRLPPRPAAPGQHPAAGAAAAGGGGEDTTTSVDGETTTMDLQAMMEQVAQMQDGATSASEDGATTTTTSSASDGSATTVDGSTTTVAQGAADEQQYCLNEGCYNLAAAGCANMRCGAHCSRWNLARQTGHRNRCDRHGISSSDEEDGDTTTATMGTTAYSSDSSVADTPNPVEYAASGRRFCQGGDCRNIAADDCVNGCCGRCCVIHGQYQCERHMA